MVNVVCPTRTIYSTVYPVTDAPDTPPVTSEWDSQGSKKPVYSRKVTLDETGKNFSIGVVLCTTRRKGRNEKKISYIVKNCIIHYIEQ